MGSESIACRARRAGVVFAALALGGAPLVCVQAQTKPLIYTCVDGTGKKLTSDRPISECNGRDQRELNSDGSFKRIVPPTPTADERAEEEARQREAEAERVRRNDAVRRDRNMLQRYPNELEHNKARSKALDDVRKAVHVSEARIALLLTERKPLLDEAEFYVGKTLPTKLKLSLDANDASLEAQKSLVQNQTTEVGRINALYDAELVRLKKLWAGAPPGSLGPLPTGDQIAPATLARPASSTPAKATPSGPPVAPARAASK